MRYVKLLQQMTAATLITLLAAGCKKEQPPPLKSRAIFPKPASATVDPDRVSARQIILKLHEGTRIRLRSNRLFFDPAKLTPAERALLGRVQLSDEQIRADVGQINLALQQDPPLNVARLFLLQDEVQLSINKARGEEMSHEELADLDLYYNLTFEAPNVSRAKKLIDWLNRLPSVEIAYPQPIPFSAGDIQPATVPDPPLSQGYLRKAPTGINALYAWTYPGGKGAGVKLVDVESGWHLNHVDLPVPEEYFFGNGLNVTDESHGTAVLGVLAARDNGFGATGVVPDAAIGWSSPILVSFPNFVYFVAAAIDKAASVLSAGDVLLIEQHFQGWDGGTPCPGTCNCAQYAFAPVENWQADFDAIRNATARGIVVVEAAGNGQMDLDAPHYQGRFDRKVRDSEAILVGAGSPGGLSPLCFTNFGSRVDVQGWGSNVETLGYGNGAGLRINGDDARQWYTRSFAGTSSASPIVAGAISAIQGIRLARGDPRLEPATMRSLLRSTGTPQAPGAKQIGPLPDLRKALHTLLPQSAEFVSQSVPVSMLTSQRYVISITLKNSGTTTWTPTGNYNLGSQNEVDNTVWGVNRIAVPNAVAPGAAVPFGFTITAPSTPGSYDLQWRIVQDDVEWFGDLTPNIAVDVRPDNRSAFISQSVPTTMLAGQSYRVPVTMRNTGSNYWTSFGKYNLGSQNPATNLTWGPNNRVALPTSVAPGAQVTFLINVTAPSQPGTYDFQWRMTQQPYGWFGELTPNVSVQVSQASNNAAFVTQSVPTKMLIGASYAVSITMKNVGTSTWAAGTQYRLGSENPRDNTRWNITRVELPSSVPPGSEVTFGFEVTPITGQGIKNFQWRMVQEGIGWFGEFTPNVSVGVQVEPALER